MRTVYYVCQQTRSPAATRRMGSTASLRKFARRNTGWLRNSFGELASRTGSYLRDCRSTFTWFGFVDLHDIKRIIVL